MSQLSIFHRKSEITDKLMTEKFKTLSPITFTITLHNNVQLPDRAIIQRSSYVSQSDIPLCKPILSVRHHEKKNNSQLKCVKCVSKGSRFAGCYHTLFALHM